METFLIGTLFEEEEKEQKKNFYNQIVKHAIFKLKFILIHRPEMKKDIKGFMERLQEDSRLVIKIHAVRKKAGLLRNFFPLAQNEV
jgi:hypothetical protein